MKNIKTTTKLCTLFTLALAAACGGGGGGEEAGGNPPIDLTATPDGAVTPMGASVEILIGNNDVGPAEEVEITSEPEHGTLSEEGPVSITYTPESGFLGLDTFKYRTKTGDTLSESTLVQILVTEEVVFLDGQGAASTLRYVLTDGEGSLSVSEDLASLPDDAQGVPFAHEGDLDPAPLLGVDQKTVKNYALSPDGRWIAAIGDTTSFQGVPMSRLMVVDRITHMKSEVFTAQIFSAITGVEFTASGDHLVFCTTGPFQGGMSSYRVSLEDGLPQAGSAEPTTPAWGLGRVISQKLSPNADVCAIRIANENNNGDKLYAIDLSVGAASFKSMVGTPLFQDVNRTCPEYAWVPSDVEGQISPIAGGYHVLLYRTDIGAAEGRFQLLGKKTTQQGQAWRIDTDNDPNGNAAVSSFAISPNGELVAYRKDGEIQGRHALYSNTTSQLVFGDAERVLTPGPGSTTADAYVWGTASDVIYAQIDDGALFPGPSELHIYATEPGSGGTTLVSDEEGIQAGLIALGADGRSGVLYRRSYEELVFVDPQGQQQMMQKNSVALWSRDTGTTFTKVLIEDFHERVVISNDGRRLAFFRALGSAYLIDVAAALANPLQDHTNLVQGASPEGFTFMRDSSRWTYLELATSDLMLGGVGRADVPIERFRPDSRKIEALPSLGK